MIWYSFGIGIEKKKERLQEPPDNGFELTNDGEYDMKNKLSKNTNYPVESSGESKKCFVDKFRGKCMLLNGAEVFNAQGKKIGNVEDPQDDMNYVNNSYLKESILPLSENNYFRRKMINFKKKKDKYGGKGKIVRNIEDPMDTKRSSH
ncbi:hypothetical protein TNIN_139721 [Trichonephila inaurata madagascariensis]|uniref:Uncharacterized protein n=1 Tax=Trichonephila inaurata madagascariensis TaxID=2747483 RepID=A0A8X6Y7L1_9ARAC|nr:hypothetical protein TNIN_139721 [Trichonephila inaurata madagascariensis]